MVGRPCITCAHNLRRQQVSLVNQSVKELTVDGSNKLLGCTVFCHEIKQEIKQTNTIIIRMLSPCMDKAQAKQTGVYLACSWDLGTTSMFHAICEHANHNTLTYAEVQICEKMKRVQGIHAYGPFATASNPRHRLMFQLCPSACVDLAAAVVSSQKQRLKVRVTKAPYETLKPGPDLEG